MEAESLAFVACAAHGLASDDYTVPYVAHWSGGDRDLVRDTSVRVLSCARQILTVAAPGGDGTVTATAVSRQAERAMAARHRLDGADHEPARAVRGIG